MQPVVSEVRVKVDTELRAGPGPEYETTGTHRAGDSVRPVARDEDGRWLKLESNHWILSRDVEGDTGPLPIAAALGAPNSPPVFVTYVDGNPKEVTELTNYENTFGSSVSALDENEEDTEFGFEITGGDDASLFTLYRVAQSQSVIVTFAKKPDFEAPHDKNADNTYEIQLTVTSGTGDRTLSAATNFKYRVLDREELPGVPVFLKDGPTPRIRPSPSIGSTVQIPGSRPTTTCFDIERRIRTATTEADRI